MTTATETAVWDEIGDTAGERLRSELIEMVLKANAGAPRSVQRHLGPSEVGDPCTHCLAAKILGVYEEDPWYDPWCAIIGTATHKWLERAAERDNKRRDAAWCTETRVMPDDELLPKGGVSDLYQDTTGTVIDHKVVGTAPLKSYKANGPGEKYRRQLHIYGLGFANSGLTVNRVAIAFWCRGGRTADLHVWSEPYDETYARDALNRYKTLRDLCTAGGPAILPNLPSDPACYTCKRSNKATA